MIYILVIASNFDPAVNAKLIEAFGATPFGLPVTIVVALVETILYIPMPWIFWHGMLILDQALEDGVIARPQRFFWYLFRVGAQHPRLRRSQRITIGGLIYCVAICGIWILYAAMRRI